MYLKCNYLLLTDRFNDKAIITAAKRQKRITQKRTSKNHFIFKGETLLRRYKFFGLLLLRTITLSLN